MTQTANKKLMVTGSSGLIGSEVCMYFSGCGFEIHGVDNNLRMEFFGDQGDTRWNRDRLMRQVPAFTHHEIDIRDRQAVLDLIEHLRPHAIVHCAAQPSHDLAAKIPFDDFDTNAGGTLNLLEATRQFCAGSPFVFMSTNKVYGDGPNKIPLKELETRWDFADKDFQAGISESFSVDQCKHSLFGASKLAADILVQEYGRYFDMPTCSLRGGCLTGPNHSGVELHGFLSFLVRSNLEQREYTVFGYEGKQVRDNIHSEDVVRFIRCFIDAPRSGEVYNIGGGKENTCSILEAFDKVGQLSGKKQRYSYVPENRIGDHICYYSDLSKAHEHYPDWNISHGIDSIFEEIVRSWKIRLN